MVPSRSLPELMRAAARVVAAVIETSDTVRVTLFVSLKFGVPLSVTTTSNV